MIGYAEPEFPVGPQVHIQQVGDHMGLKLEEAHGHHWLIWYRPGHPGRVLGLSRRLGLHRLRLQRSLCWELWDHTGKKEMSREEEN